MEPAKPQFGSGNPEADGENGCVGVGRDENVCMKGGWTGQQSTGLQPKHLLDVLALAERGRCWGRIVWVVLPLPFVCLMLAFLPWHLDTSELQKTWPVSTD